jgi:hypothetical protein
MCNAVIYSLESGWIGENVFAPIVPFGVCSRPNRILMNRTKENGMGLTVEITTYESMRWDKRGVIYTRTMNCLGV